MAASRVKRGSRLARTFASRSARIAFCCGDSDASASSSQELLLPSVGLRCAHPMAGADSGHQFTFLDHTLFNAPDEMGCIPALRATGLVSGGWSPAF